jgi:hypothetical protein
MQNVIILITTMAMLFYFYRTIWKGRTHILKYISAVGKEKPTRNSINPKLLILFLIIHGFLGIAAAYLMYKNERGTETVWRLLLSIISALVFLLLLYAFYFCIIVIIKEIIYMKDRTINFILIYSFFTSIMLLVQIYSDDISYPKAFLWVSASLYIINIFSIGRIIWTIFKKKIHVKSIWSIAVINTSFAILALSNFAFEIQKVYSVACYSRTINSWGDALYFVVITFFTVGYGDLYPVCETTKILTMIIILSGFTFTAVFVSAALSATVEHFGNIDKK